MKEHNITMKDEKVKIKLDKQAGQEMLIEELKNIDPQKLVQLNHKLEYETYLIPDCPERMLNKKASLNCEDTNDIEEIFDKMIQDALEVCPLIILERDIKEGIPMHRSNTDSIKIWMNALNKENFKCKIPELEMLQQEEKKKKEEE